MYVHLVEFVLVDKKKRRLLSIIAPVGWMMVYQGWFLDWFLVLLSIEVKKKAIHNPQANREYKQNRPLESQHPILTWEYTKVTSVLRFEDWSYKRHSPQPVESIQTPALSMVNTADSYL